MVRTRSSSREVIEVRLLCIEGLRIVYGQLTAWGEGVRMVYRCHSLPRGGTEGTMDSAGVAFEPTGAAVRLFGARAYPHPVVP